MNGTAINPQAVKMAETLAKAGVARGTTAWTLDADVQNAIDALYAQMDGKVAKRTLINELLRRALIAEPDAA